MNYRQPSASCVQSSLFGEPGTVPAIAAACLPRVSWSYAHLIDHADLIEHADLGAELIPELEFDQALRWKSRAVEMAPAAARGLVWIRRWRVAVTGVVCQLCVACIVHFPPVARIKSLRTPNKSGL